MKTQTVQSTRKSSFPLPEENLLLKPLQRTLKEYLGKGESLTLGQVLVYALSFPKVVKDLKAHLTCTEDYIKFLRATLETLKHQTEQSSKSTKNYNEKNTENQSKR